jgi:hypothetical protein
LTLYINSKKHLKNINIPHYWGNGVDEPCVVFCVASAIIENGNSKDRKCMYKGEFLFANTIEIHRDRGDRGIIYL